MEPIPVFRKAQQWLGFLVFILVLESCSRPERIIQISGATMGTTYNLKMVAEPGTAVAAGTLQAAVDSLLEVLNHQLSTYDTTSEISRFNRYRSTRPFAVSRDFAYVIQEAQGISEVTGGAFDVTILPLVELWGFGPRSRGESRQPPPPEDIREQLARTGYRHLEIHADHLRKKIPELEVDVNAIAKGYGVDAVAALLSARGFTDFMVEIGGEVVCRGVSGSGRPWRIGIEAPHLDAVPGSDLQAVIPLADQALATSGDYRNYFLREGILYTHAIDPRTGMPIRTGVASASVIAPTCLLADALATALMVLGEQAGLELVESLAGVEALLYVRTGAETVRVVKSSGMPVLEEN